MAAASQRLAAASWRRTTARLRLARPGAALPRPQHRSIPGNAVAATRTMAGSPSSSDPALPAGPVFFMDGFVARQWGPGAEGTAFDPAAGGPTMAAFCDRLHAAHAAGDAPLVDGYAPFCKHVFLRNWVAGIKPGAVPVSAANQGQLRSGYVRRRPEELAVLARWFPSDCAAAAARPDAAWLDVILYSREQLAAEAAAMPADDRAGRAPQAAERDLLPPWGVISVKAQDVVHELPMQPITMLRNALGRAEGGSGVPLDRGAYEAAVAYWDGHAAVLDGAVAGA